MLIVKHHANHLSVGREARAPVGPTLAKVCHLFT
jgi:hypothetical protein